MNTRKLFAFASALLFVFVGMTSCNKRTLQSPRRMKTWTSTTSGCTVNSPLSMVPMSFRDSAK